MAPGVGPGQTPDVGLAKDAGVLTGVSAGPPEGGSVAVARL